MKHRAEILEESIAKLPREQLANLPTPLQEAPRLSRALGGPRILFKRDDLTGFPLAGNKTRMFEFSLAEAKRLGADTVVHNAGVQSNYCRQLAAGCSKLGLKAYLPLTVIRGDEDFDLQGNLLLMLLMGAEVELVTSKGGWEERNRAFVHQGISKKLTEMGRKVFIARGTDRDTALETVSYVNCALEIYRQLQETNESIDYIVLAAYDTTQVGLILGAKFLRQKWEILGFCPMAKRKDAAAAQAKIAEDTADLLSLDVAVNADEVRNTTEYAGEGYGVPTEAGMDAIRLVAQEEGILLDPVYTGKAMSGLLDYIQKGKIRKDKTVLFLHTGGWPALFAYRHAFKNLNEHLTVSHVESYLPEGG